MNKTKLAIIGASIATAITIGSAVQLIHTIDALNKQTHKLQQEIKVLQDELNKSKAEVEKKSIELQEKQKEIDEINKQLQEANKILNDLSIDISYDPNDLRKPSNVSLAQIKKALEGTSLTGLEEAFFKGERVYGVNAMFLIGLVANESGWGTSPRAREHNNMTGFEVYTPLSRGGRFSSKEESILITARLLSNDYLKPEGEHYNGYSIWDVNVKYSQKNGQPNTEWSKVINRIANDLVKKINNK